MSVHTEIEINASPEECRKVFLDFANWKEMKADLVQSVERKDGKTGDVNVGDVLECVFLGGFKAPVTVLENSARALVWRGDVFYVLSGEHTFAFEPSERTPSGTRFVNSEKYFRLNRVMMRLFPPTAHYQKFCEDFKRRVESLENRVSTETSAFSAV